jgi:hypothetical protein
MSPVPSFAPPPLAVADMIREITGAWQLDNILDALPRGLNPYRTKDVMTWGVEFITRLRDLAILTAGGHEGVVTALMERSSQPVTAVRPDVERWTVIRDIDHLILQIDTLTVAASHVNQNPPRRAASRLEGLRPVFGGRRLATATRSSQRIANRVASAANKYAADE